MSRQIATQKLATTVLLAISLFAACAGTARAQDGLPDYAAIIGAPTAPRPTGRPTRGATR